MATKKKTKGKLPWHSAFFAGIQIEFEKEAEKLTFENEHQLGTDPMRIDILIIKKHTEERIQKNIGRIFREYNIIEYKSPEQYLSIDAFYKVLGYACFYKSDVQHVDIIKIMDLVVRANKEIFKEARGEMCDALMELMDDVIQEKVNEGQQKGISIGLEKGLKQKLIELIEIKRSKGKSVEQIADDLEETVETIQELMKTLN